MARARVQSPRSLASRATMVAALQGRKKWGQRKACRTRAGNAFPATIQDRGKPAKPASQATSPQEAAALAMHARPEEFPRTARVIATNVDMVTTPTLGTPSVWVALRDVSLPQAAANAASALRATYRPRSRVAARDAQQAPSRTTADSVYRAHWGNIRSLAAALATSALLEKYHRKEAWVRAQAAILGATPSMK